MSIEIRELSEQDKVDYKAKHERAEPKDFVLMDGRLAYSFYNTKEEAEADKVKLENMDKVSELFEAWVTDISDELNLPEEDIKGIIKGDYL